jgi:hypothetical protein
MTEIISVAEFLRIAAFRAFFFYRIRRASLAFFGARGKSLNFPRCRSL